MPESAGARGDGDRFRRVLQRVSVGHTQRRRVRDEAGDVGVQPGEGKPARQSEPRRARRARCGRSHRVVQGHAVEAGPLAGALGARIRGLPVRAVDARRVRRLLEAARHLRGRLLRPVRRRAADPHVELVRRLRAHRDRQLRCVEQEETRAGAPHHGAVDARRPLENFCGRRRFRRGRHHRQQSRAALARVSPALVRSLGERCRQRRGQRARGAACS